jgi:hypothetical protein
MVATPNLSPNLGINLLTFSHKNTAMKTCHSKECYVAVG